MLFSLFAIAHAFESERPIPTIVITRRTFTPIHTPFGPLNDPMLFEKLFKEKPHFVFKSTPIEEEKAPIYKSNRQRTKEAKDHRGNLYKRRSLEDKVKDKSEFTDEFKETYKCTKSHSMGFFFLFFILIAASGIVGYFVGKAAESRNYVRVPSTN